jgi:hypothetical protein
MSQENVEIVRGLHESFADGDNESPFAVYDPAIEWDMSRAPLPGEESVFHVWAQVWTLRNRAVVRMRIYPDHAGALEPVGLRE